MRVFMWSPAAFGAFLAVLAHAFAASPAPLIDGSALGAELGGYALRVRDQSRRKVAEAVHAMMHAGLPGNDVAAAGEGRDILKQWSAAHVSSPPKAEAKVGRPHEMADNVASHATDHSSVRNARTGSSHAPVIQKVSKSFSHAHALMHGFETAELPTETAATEAPVPSAAQVAEPDVATEGSLVASGGDLIANWAKAHDESVANQAKASVRKELETAATVSSASSMPLRPEPQAPSVSVREDIQSLRSTMHNMQIDGPHEASHEAELHSAMHQIGNDVPDLASPEPTALPVSDALKADGADALEQWSKAHEPKQVPIFKLKGVLLSPKTVATPAVPLVGEQADDVSKMQESTNKWHQSSVHNAMRSIGSDVPEADLVDASPQASAESLKASGAEALESWSKAHQKAQIPKFKFMMPIDAIPRVEEREIVQPVSHTAESWRTSVKSLHQSALHEAMRSIGSDVADVDTADAQSQHTTEAFKADGADELAAWSTAQKKAERPKFMMPASALPVPEAQHVAEHVEDVPAAPKQKAIVDMYLATPAPETDMVALAMARGFGKKVEVSLEAPVSKAAELHEAMQSMAASTGSIGDVTTPSVDAPAVPVVSAEADGADELAAWSGAQKKAQRSKFMMPAVAPVAPPAHFAEPVENVQATPKPKQMVDMYLATPAPETDMVAVALSRGFGKKAEVSLEAPVSKAVELHEAMQSMAVSTGSIGEVKTQISDTPAVPAVSAEADGADELAAWSNAQKKAQRPKFMMPADVSPVAQSQHIAEQVEVVPAAPKQKAIVDMYLATPAPEADMVALALARGFGKKVEVSLEAPVSKAAELHEAMQSMAASTGSIGEVTTHSGEAPAVSPVSAEAAGADELAAWANAQKQANKPKFLMPKEYVVATPATPQPKLVVPEPVEEVHPATKQNALVDMYPPTPAPETDMVALAMARGFGKKVEVSLEAPVSKAGELHQAMQSMADSTASIGEVSAHSEDAPAAAAASDGADLLKQWSRSHISGAAAA